MIILEIRGESGIAWNPTKCNNFNLTKRRLYKGLKHTKLGVGKLGRETVRKTQGNTEELRETRERFLY